MYVRNHSIVQFVIFTTQDFEVMVQYSRRRKRLKNLSRITRNCWYVGMNTTENVSEAFGTKPQITWPFQFDFRNWVRIQSTFCPTARLIGSIYWSSESVLRLCAGVPPWRQCCQCSVMLALWMSRRGKLGLNPDKPYQLWNSPLERNQGFCCVK